MTNDNAHPAIPDHDPSEPTPRPLSGVLVLCLTVLKALYFGCLASLTLPLWLPYLISLPIWGVPPNVARFRQIGRYLRLVWTVRPSEPALDVPRRLYLTAAVLRKIIVMPLWGLAWQIDLLLYGQALRDTPIVAPLIEISAGRSGSTQIARYLEEDPLLVAPGLLQLLFPYLWMWRLARATLGRFVTQDQVRSVFSGAFSPEFVQRHELDPFRTDTFEGALLLSHLNTMALSLGPATIVDDINFAKPAVHNRELWQETFVELLDGIGRKTLRFAGPGSSGPRRLFIKGHFLAAADALEQRYPDARFLTLVRNPVDRIRSGINYLRVNPIDRALAPVPFSWLTEAALKNERDYCDLEMQWYTKTDGARRCVLRFDAYCNDLGSAMQQIYSTCLDCDELPSHVALAHTPRVRHDYLVDRTWEELGIDPELLRAQFSDYIRWCTTESALDSP